MALVGAHAAGATPLRPEDVAQLKKAVSWVKTIPQLNDVEAANIAQADTWARKSPLLRLPRLLSTASVQSIHKKMFGDVWKWAGKIRTHDLGNEFASAFYLITTDLENLWLDAKTWLDHNTFPPNELAVRLHHRLVRIHPFTNGNGRHARFVADLMLERQFGLPRLNWRGDQLHGDGETRAAYIDALRQADHGNYGPLLTFALAPAHADEIPAAQATAGEAVAVATPDDNALATSTATAGHDADPG